MSGGGGKFGGLSGGVVVGDGVVVGGGGGSSSVMGRGGRSELSVVGLTFGSVGGVGVTCVVLEVGEGGGGSVMGSSVRRGVMASVAAAAASLGRGACSNSSGCDGPVDRVQRAFVVEQPSRWKVSFSFVVGGRLVGAAGGRGVASSSASAAAGGRKSLPVALRMRDR